MSIYVKQVVAEDLVEHIRSNTLRVRASRLSKPRVRIWLQNKKLPLILWATDCAFLRCSGEDLCWAFCCVVSSVI